MSLDSERDNGGGKVEHDTMKQTTTTTTTTTTNIALEECNQLIKERNLEKHVNLLFVMIAGSHCYNCNVETSDFDILGVYVANTKDICFNLPEIRTPDLIQKTSKGGSQNDICLYEAGKFCELLQTGNPLIVQMLFTKRLILYDSEAFQNLKTHRMKFITAQTVQAYIGYVKSEMKQAQSKSKFEYSKCLYHGMRLVMELERIIEYKEPQIWFDSDSAERNVLMKIRGSIDLSTRAFYLDEISQRLQTIEHKKPWTKIPEKNSKHGTESFNFLNQWIVSLRQQFL